MLKSINASIIPEIQQQFAEIQTIRRDIHAHPELSYSEQRTSNLIANKLTEWGIPIQRNLGKTGIVGILSAGTSNRAIGLRADMDALPIAELNTFTHRSEFPGKMHACGHDGHTAMLLAAAQYLSNHRHFDGTVYFIFQPAEEEGAGAQAMINDGLFKLFPMQAVYGMHNWPGLPVGQFAVGDGPVMASSSTFHITLNAKGCHAALPHLGLDPIPVAAQIILAFQNILTRNVNPLETGIISVTQVHIGDAYNVIAETGVLGGTVRTFSSDLLNLIEMRMRKIAEHICLANDIVCDFAFHRNYPATVNDPKSAELCREVLTDFVGRKNVIQEQATMGAEDFGFMLQVIPGCYCFIGNGESSHSKTDHLSGHCNLHNAFYDFNDEIIPLGATYWVRLVEKSLPFA